MMVSRKISASVDVVADKVLAPGRGAMLAKMDIKQAYRMVPIHPQDRRLLGMRWEGVVYVDKTLPSHLACGRPQSSFPH